MAEELQLQRSGAEIARLWDENARLWEENAQLWEENAWLKRVIHDAGLCRENNALSQHKVEDARRLHAQCKTSSVD